MIFDSMMKTDQQPAWFFFADDLNTFTAIILKNAISKDTIYVHLRNSLGNICNILLYTRYKFCDPLIGCSNQQCAKYTSGLMGKNRSPAMTVLKSAVLVGRYKSHCGCM